jgi:hypothetical protein
MPQNYREQMEAFGRNTIKAFEEFRKTPASNLLKQSDKVYRLLKRKKPDTEVRLVTPFEGIRSMGGLQQQVQGNDSDKVVVALRGGEEEKLVLVGVTGAVETRHATYVMSQQFLIDTRNNQLQLFYGSTFSESMGWQEIDSNNKKAIQFIESLVEIVDPRSGESDTD